MKTLNETKKLQASQVAHPRWESPTHNRTSGVRGGLVPEDEARWCLIQQARDWPSPAGRGASQSRPQQLLPRTSELRHDQYRTRCAAFQIFFSESLSRFQASSRAFLFASFLSLGSSPARMKPWPAPS